MLEIHPGNYQQNMYGGEYDPLAQQQMHRMGFPTTYLQKKFANLDTKANASSAVASHAAISLQSCARR